MLSVREPLHRAVLHISSFRCDPFLLQFDPFVMYKLHPYGLYTVNRPTEEMVLDDLHLDL